MDDEMMKYVAAYWCALGLIIGLFFGLWIGHVV